VDCRDTLVVCTISAAEKDSPSFDSVADDFTPAVLALGSEGVNGTLETIEIVRDSVHEDLQRLVVVIAADFAFIHMKVRNQGIVFPGCGPVP
jgi:hypothetical protein